MPGLVIGKATGSTQCVAIAGKTTRQRIKLRAYKAGGVGSRNVGFGASGQEIAFMAKRATITQATAPVKRREYQLAVSPSIWYSVSMTNFARSPSELAFFTCFNCLSKNRTISR